MPALDFIKDIYRKMEDAFYTALDWLDAHNVPAYKVHDWLEDHGIPPFPAFLAVIFILISGAILAVAPSSSPTYDVIITVYDPDYNPVPGAKVTLYAADGYYTTTTTDDTGTAYFYNMPEGPYRVSIEAEGFESVVKKPLEGLTGSFTLEYAATSTKTVCVRVLDGDSGTAAEGVTVVASYTSGGTTGTKYLTWNSLYNVYCAEFPKDADVNITVTGGDYKEKTVTVRDEYSKENPYVITVYRSASLGGTTYTVVVKVFFDGQPEKASVSFRPETGTDIVASKNTDNDGKAVFTLDPGKYIMAVIAQGEHSGWTAQKVVEINGDTEISVDLKEEGKDTNGKLGDVGDVTKVTSKPGEEETLPSEFNVTICPKDEVTDQHIKNATVTFANQTKTTGENGCARFEGIKPTTDTPYPLIIDAGDNYQKYEGTLAVGGNLIYEPVIRVKDAPASVSFSYIEFGGAKALALTPGRSFTLHFTVSLPYHIQSATFKLSNEGAEEFTFNGSDEYSSDVYDKRGKTFDISAPVTIEEGAEGQIIVFYDLEYADEDGSVQHVSGSVTLDIIPVLLLCGNNDTALSFSVLGLPEDIPLIVGKEYTLEVYYGSCADDTPYSEVNALVNGRSIALSTDSLGRYSRATGTFSIPEEEKDKRAKVDVRLVSSSGAIVNRRLKYYDVAISVGSYNINFDPSTVGEEGKILIFRNYQTTAKVCASSSYADHLDIALEYKAEGTTKRVEKSVSLSSTEKCEEIPFQPEEGPVNVTLTFKKGDEILDTVTKSYSVIDHTNKVALTIVDADTGKPVPNASVSLQGKHNNYSGTTDEEGKVSFTVKDDEYTVTISADGYLTAERTLGFIKTDTSRTFHVYKPVDNPEVSPLSLWIGKVGNIQVAALTPGNAYALTLSVRLPPRVVSGYLRLTMLSDFSEDAIIDVREDLPSSNLKANTDNAYTVTFTVPDSVPPEGTLTLTYEVNAGVESEGGKEYKYTKGTISFSAVPKKITCGGKSVAVLIVPLNEEGKPAEALTPPPTGVEKITRQIRVYYGKCSPSEIYAQKLALYINDEPYAPAGASLRPLFLVSSHDFSVEITKDQKGQKITAIASVRGEEGILGKGIREIPIGYDLCVKVWTDPLLPVAGDDLHIYAQPLDCETQEVPDNFNSDDLTVEISGGSAELGKNPPLQFSWDPEHKYYKIDVHPDKAGSILLSCSSPTNKHNCTLLADVVWVFKRVNGIEITGPSTVYVPEAGNSYEFEIEGKVALAEDTRIYLYDDVADRQGKRPLVQIKCSCGEGEENCKISAKADVPSYIAGKNPAKMTIHFYNPEGQKGQCEISVGGWYDSGAGKVYVAGKYTVTVDPLSQISIDKIDITPELPSQIYTNVPMTFTVTAKVTGPNNELLSTKDWILTRKKPEISCEKGPSPDVTLSPQINKTDDDKGYTFSVTISAKEPAQNCKLTLYLEGKVGGVTIYGQTEFHFDVKPVEELPFRVTVEPTLVDLINNKERTVTITIKNKESVGYPLYVTYPEDPKGVEVTGKEDKLVLPANDEKKLTLTFKLEYTPENAENYTITFRLADLDDYTLSVTIPVYASISQCINGSEAGTKIVGNKLILVNGCPVPLPTFKLIPFKDITNNEEILVSGIPKNGVVTREVQIDDTKIAGGEDKAEHYNVLKYGKFKDGVIEVPFYAKAMFVNTDGKVVMPYPSSDWPYDKLSCSGAFCGGGEIANYLAEEIKEIFENAAEGAYSCENKNIKNGSCNPTSKTVYFYAKDTTLDWSEEVVGALRNMGVEGVIAYKADTEDRVPGNIYYKGETDLKCGYYKAILTPLYWPDTKEVAVEVEIKAVSTTADPKEEPGVSIAKKAEEECEATDLYHVPLHLNLGRYSCSIQNGVVSCGAVRVNGVIEKDGAIIASYTTIPNTTPISSKDLLDIVNNLKEGEYVPFNVIGIVTNGTPDKGVVIQEEDCGNINAIAEIGGGEKLLKIYVCSSYKEKHEDWKQKVADILKAIFTAGKEASIEVKVFNGRIYVVGTGGGTEGTGLPGNGVYYFAPGATTEIKVDVDPRQLPVDGGDYKITIVPLYDTKKCSGVDLTVFGYKTSQLQDKGILKPISDPKIKVYVPAKESCNTTIGFQIQLTPVGEGLEDKPVVFEITLKPLEVKFQNLVSALTCSSFDLSKLSEQVPKTVLAAALGDGDPCSVISNTNGGTGNDIPNLAGYNWQIPETSNLILAAKKGGNPDWAKKDYDFTIEFKGKDMGVWVKDAEEWKGLEKGSCALPDNPDKSIFRIVEDTHGPEAYQQYLLEVTYGDMITKCRGLEEYGSKKNILDRALSGTNLAKGFALYSGSCAAATLLCGALFSPITGGESIVMSGKTAAIDCTVAPLMAVATYRITELVTDTKSNKALWTGSLLAPAAAGGVRTYIFDTYYTANKLIAQLRTVGQPGGLTDDQAQKVAQQLAKLIKKLKRLGFEVDNKLLTNIDDMQNASGDELKKLIAKTDWDKLKKQIRTPKAIFTRGAVAAIGCRSVGAIAGTVAWYLTAEGLHIPHLHVKILSINPAARISINAGYRAGLHGEGDIIIR